MIIQIGQYQLKKIDSYNFGVIKTATVKKGKLTGTTYTDRTLYYPRLDQAIIGMFELMALDGFGEEPTGATGYLEELCEKYKEYKDEILKQLEVYEKARIHSKD